MDKKTALHELNSLLQQADSLAGQRAFSADHVRWITNTLELLEEVFGREKYYATFKSFTWRAESFVVGGYNDYLWDEDPNAAIEREHHKAYLAQLESARGLLQAATDSIKRAKDIDSLNTKNGADSVSQIRASDQQTPQLLDQLIKDNQRMRKQIQYMRYTAAIILALITIGIIVIIQVDPSIWPWLENHEKSTGLKISGVLVMSALTLVVAHDRFLKLGVGTFAVSIGVGILQII